MEAKNCNIFAIVLLSLEKWLYGKSEIFSSLCGESVTRMEVINVHLGIVAMLLMGALVNAIGNLI